MIEDFPFFVTEEEDGSISLEWDPNHHITSVFNDWTEKDFEEMILKACASALEKHG